MKNLDATLKAKIMQRFCDGRTPTEIFKEFKEYNITRQTPHQVLKDEAKRLRYTPLLSVGLEAQIKKTWPRLENASVVHSALPDHVSSRTAELLVELIRHHFAANPESREIHLGFAGGRMLRETARVLAGLIEAEPPLHRVQFHFRAVLAAFNALSPWNDPNGFFGYFADNPLIQARFWGLPAPGIVAPHEFELLKGIRGVQDAFKQVDKLDIVVTSAGAHWEKKCSRLSRLYSDDSFRQLRGQDCLGDLMWRPLNAAGPITADSPDRAMTLFEISKLSTLVRANKKVVLAICTCGGCGEPKSDVLQAILNWKQPELHILTHVVLDSLTAGAILA